MSVQETVPTNADGALVHTNPITGKAFTSIEGLTSTQPLDDAMTAQNYQYPEWATFKQWKSGGRTVSKYQKGTRLVGSNGFFWYVFNVAQTEPRKDR